MGGIPVKEEYKMEKSDGQDQSQPEHLQKYLPICSMTAYKFEFIVCG